MQLGRINNLSKETGQLHCEPDGTVRCSGARCGRKPFARTSGRPSVDRVLSGAIAGQSRLQEHRERSGVRIQPLAMLGRCFGDLQQLGAMNALKKHRAEQAPLRR
jgi:hypothetical protein